MNARNRARTVISTCVATTFIAGLGVASTAEAKTETTGGGTSAGTVGQGDGVDDIVYRRKVQMAQDYVTYAAARWAAQH